MLSPPRYATPRRPDRPTTGAPAAVLANLCGVALQPWQRATLDVAGELVRHDDTGDLVHAYRIVTVSVGRRAGKTVLILAQILATITAHRRRFAFYTAQNGKAGAERFRNDWVPLIAAAPILTDRIKPRLTNGTETLTDRDTASYMRVFAPIPKALHGDAADLIVFDEAWAFDVDRGRELEIAAFPLTATRPGAQVWIISAAGDVTSTWWAAWLDAGRSAALADTGGGHCHIEWTADGTDPYTWDDEAVWIAAHPAIRTADNPTGVIDLAFLRDQYTRDPEQFARSYLNVTDRTGTTSTPIDPVVWDALAADAPPRDLVAFGVSVAPDQTSAAVVACHHGPAGAVVELVDHRPGYSWVVGRVTELVDRWDVATVGFDPAGQSPAAVLARPFDAAGIPVTRFGLADVTGSAADLVAAVVAGTVRHVPHPAFTAAVAGARRRLLPGGAWAFDRRGADVDVSPVEAAAFARWCHPAVHNAPSPMIR